MAMSLKTRTTIIQFILIIVISATIAGVVGGVTSRISKWKAEEVVQVPENSTSSLVMSSREMERRMVGKIFVA